MVNKFPDKRHVSPEKNAVFLSLLSTGICALCGAFVMYSAAKWHSSQTFAVFSFGWGVFAFADYLSAFGIPESVFCKVSGYPFKNPRQTHLLFRSAVAAVIFTGCAVSLVLWLVSFAYPPGYGCAMSAVSIIVPLCAVNKTVLWYLNALMKFRLVAAGRALRYITAAVSMIFFRRSGIDENLLILVFAPGEILLSIFLFLKITRIFPMVHIRAGSVFPVFRHYFSWISDMAAKHLSFGWRVMPGTALLDGNIRMGLFLIPFIPALRENADVAAVFAGAVVMCDALNQVLLTVRNVFAPGLMKAFSEIDVSFQKLLSAEGKVLRAGLTSFLLSILFSVSMAAGVWGLRFAGILSENSVYSRALEYAPLILTAMVVFAPMSPFTLILQGFGYPGANSLIMVILTVLHGIFAYVMGTYFSVWGLAMAMCMYFVLLCLAVMMSIRFVFRKKAGDAGYSPLLGLME